jgi:hypothetical protein
MSHLLDHRISFIVLGLRQVSVILQTEVVFVVPRFRVVVTG